MPAALPYSIGQLRALWRLDLRDNKIAELPFTIGNLTALMELNLSSNWLTAMSGCLALTNINLTGNKQLTAAGLEPFCTSSPPKLATLYLQSCDLDDSIGNLKALTFLQLAFNKLSDYPFSIGLLKANGCYVDTDGNPGGGTLVGPSKEGDSRKCTKCGRGFLTFCGSETCPQCQEDAKVETKANASEGRDKLSNNPRCGICSKRVEKAGQTNCWDCAGGITFSESYRISSVLHATKLDFSGLGLAALPRTMSQLKALTTLFVGFNKLPSTEVDFIIESFPQLTSLDLQSLGLTDTIGQLRALEKLFAGDNALADAEKARVRATLPNCKDLHLD
eukprot:g1706.t1